MISNITWSQYFLALAFMMVTYYTIIILLYYRTRVSTLIRLEKLLPRRYDELEQDERPDYDGLAKTVADLKSILESAGGEEKGAVLSRLKQRLVTYSGLQLPAFRVAIFQFIIRNATSSCGFSVTEKELDVLIQASSLPGTN
ncbi:hypothetical protein HF324_27670 [Chitinophaga oryzae]|uniref:Uncharacterized protein n=1 Tax=Chitinophaga oryzae TaxID=2725414 RepID=A0AAE6ZLI1_9BACT|nr:hypothetical protein [Chitinophaga oryzae]QJB34904.1 hypothetical protein HF329_27810 [Chitinophaga oryzae]QJB41415.1 hypothetical protein HF324_27670 [Chitinophaga oryzae]